MYWVQFVSYIVCALYSVCEYIKISLESYACYGDAPKLC